MVQQGAARFVNRQYSWYLSVSVALMGGLDLLGGLIMQQRRSDAGATMMYMIHYSLIDIPVVMYLHHKNEGHERFPTQVPSVNADRASTWVFVLPGNYQNMELVTDTFRCTVAQDIPIKSCVFHTII